MNEAENKENGHLNFILIVKISGTPNQTPLILDSSVSRMHSMAATCLVFLCEGQTKDGDFKFGA